MTEAEPQFKFAGNGFTLIEDAANPMIIKKWIMRLWDYLRHPVQLVQA